LPAGGAQAGNELSRIEIHCEWTMIDAALPFSWKRRRADLTYSPGCCFRPTRVRRCRLNFCHDGEKPETLFFHFRIYRVMKYHVMEYSRGEWREPAGDSPFRHQKHQKRAGGEDCSTPT
jgi:hypothetical protein